MTGKPYRSTPVFDELTLPQALRRDHSTKAGVWGVIRVLEGELRLHFGDERILVLDIENPGLVRPEEIHSVEPIGKVKMRVDFYDSEPDVRQS